MNTKLLVSAITALSLGVAAMAGAQTITSITPSTAVQGANGAAITVAGTGFVNGSTVNFNGASVPTNYVSSTLLTAAIPAASLTTVGTYNVTVTDPGNTVSNVATFTVTAPGMPDTGFAPINPIRSDIMVVGIALAAIGLVTAAAWTMRRIA